MNLNNEPQGVDCYRFDLSLAVLSKVLVTQSHLILNNPVDCTPPGSSVLGILQARTLEWGRHAPFQGNFLTQGIEPRSPALKADSLPSKPRGGACLKLLKKSHYFLPTQQTSFTLQKQ